MTINLFNHDQPPKTQLKPQKDGAMKKLNLLYILLAVTLLAQLLVPASMVFEKKQLYKEGIAHKFRLQPIDPNDPFRGKYMTLSFYNDYFLTDSTQKWTESEPVYLTFENDSLGFAIIKEVFRKAPSHTEDYLETQIRWTDWNNQSRVFINFPFNRFYLEERKAPRADSLYAVTTRDTSSVCWALVKISKGNAALEDVLIDGKSLIELLHTP